VRHLALAANAAYAIALLLAAYNLYLVGQRPPHPSMVEWAAFDAWFMTVLAVGMVLYSAGHVFAVINWWRGYSRGLILLTTLPLAALLAFAWVVYERTDAPGWQVVVLGLGAVLLTFSPGKSSPSN
jgi:hypothetical protein